VARWMMHVAPPYESLGQEVVGMVRKTNKKSRPRHSILVVAVDLLLWIIAFVVFLVCFDKTNIFYFVRFGSSFQWRLCP
jgi:hypothetical protein